MSFWAKDPELFLHKGRDGVVRLRRCNKETMATSSMLMKPEDFKDEGAVTKHLSLFGGHYNWDIKKYEALIDYIYPRHLLVNCRGSVIVELATDDKAAPVVYLRTLDILAMKSYGPPNRSLPARTVKYFQDGKVVPTKPTPKETKLTEDLSKKTKEAAGLQKDLAQKTKEAAGLQKDLTSEKTEKKALAKRVAELEEANKNCGTITPPPPPTFRVYTKADTGYSLTIQDGRVTLGKYNQYDVCQYWIRDDKYGGLLKDADGCPSFALVNEFTGLAIKHPTAAKMPVQLVPYNPEVVDESTLWTEHAIGDGYNTIRMFNNTGLILDAFNGDKTHGGIREGVNFIKVWEWLTGDNQRWNMVPSSKPNLNQSAP